jgi:hypothetical protein
MKAIACGRRGADGKNRETQGTFRPRTGLVPTGLSPPA